VPFENERAARAVAGALGVDRELRPAVVSKSVRCCEERGDEGEGGEDGEEARWVVIAEFTASDLKSLRSAVSSYYDLLTVSARTVEAFGFEGKDDAR